MKKVRERVMDKVKRPKVLPGKTVRVVTGCGAMYITLTYNDGRLFEVFAALGKSGACARAQSEAITRSISLSLRYGVPYVEFIKQLKGITCPSPGDYYEPGKLVMSCADAIAKVLEEYGVDSA